MLHVENSTAYPNDGVPFAWHPPRDEIMDEILKTRLAGATAVYQFPSFTAMANLYFSSNTLRASATICNVVSSVDCCVHPITKFEDYYPLDYGKSPQRPAPRPNQPPTPHLSTPPPPHPTSAHPHCEGVGLEDFLGWWYCRN